MKTKHVELLVDKSNSDIWLCDSRPGQKPKRVANITNKVFAALASDLIAEENSIESTREVHFGDGTKITITVKLEQGNEHTLPNVQQ